MRLLAEKSVSACAVNATSACKLSATILAATSWAAACWVSPLLLVHHACLGAGARSQRELDLTERFSLRGVRPQLLVVGQAAIVGCAHQQVRRTGRLLRPCHQRHHVRFAVGHVDQARIRTVCRQFDQPFIAFNPAQTFLWPATPTVAVFRFACPHPGIDNAKWFARRHDRISVSVQARHLAQRDFDMLTGSGSSGWRTSPHLF
jgi:hypothetical protein